MLVSHDVRRVLITVGLSALVAGAIGGIGVFAWGGAAPAAEAATTEVDASRFESSYAFAGGAKQEAALAAAIEALTGDMNVLIAGMARKRLTAANPVIRRIGFSLGGDPLLSSYIGGRLVESPASGAQVSWVDQNGDAVRVSQRWDGRTLVQRMSDSRGERTNTYRFTADGARMSMRVRLQSSMLPGPLEYRLDYRRVETP